ncbi:unnamed protein product [Protopolystoma xenopodis]|uniref:Uncharacterized protein n=1 Tax=Protopolystoma xenopodis TaxID=117903 RepID=A0A448X9Y6_9PLAT|nr:unnamed protein product [Protopolystoma xenopodis]
MGLEDNDGIAESKSPAAADGDNVTLEAVPNEAIPEHALTSSGSNEEQEADSSGIIDGEQQATTGLQDIRVNVSIRFASGAQVTGETETEPVTGKTLNEFTAHPWSSGAPIPTEFCLAASESMRRAKLFQVR